MCACILRTHLRTYLFTWILQLRKPRSSFYVLTYLRGSWILQLRKPRNSFYVLTYLRGFFGPAVWSTIHYLLSMYSLHFHSIYCHVQVLYFMRKPSKYLALVRCLRWCLSAGPIDAEAVTFSGGCGGSATIMRAPLNGVLYIRAHH